MTRDDRVYLDPKLARCEPSAPCWKRLTCARALAPYAQQRAPLEDYSHNIDADTLHCKWFEPVRRRPAPEPVAREVKPWPVA